jgi:hypothetical protein
MIAVSGLTAITPNPGRHSWAGWRPWLTARRAMEMPLRPNAVVWYSRPPRYKGGRGIVKHLHLAIFCVAPRSVVCSKRIVLAPPSPASRIQKRPCLKSFKPASCSHSLVLVLVGGGGDSSTSTVQQQPGSVFHSPGVQDSTALAFKTAAGGAAHAAPMRDGAEAPRRVRLPPPCAFRAQQRRGLCRLAG